MRPRPINKYTEYTLYPSGWRERSKGREGRFMSRTALEGGIHVTTTKIKPLLNHDM